MIDFADIPTFEEVERKIVLQINSCLYLYSKIYPRIGQLLNIEILQNSSIWRVLNVIFGLYEM